MNKVKTLLPLVFVLVLLVVGCTASPAPTATVQPESPTQAPTDTAEPEATPVPAATTEAEAPSEPVAAPQPAVAGHWEGKLTVQGTELQIAVDLQAEGDALAGTIDVPQQGAAGLELSDVGFEDGNLHFAMLSGPQKAEFDGQLSDEGTIAGTFKQAGVEGTFELTRAEAQAEAEEAEPLPYIEEDVTFENGDVTLAGTLTLPDAEGPHPAVILISGSGPQNRNEEIPSIPGYQPFRVIADHLTRQGIAVLRYDDRGAGESTGDHMAATSKDFAADAEAGFEYLRSRPEIDPAQVGLFGHSEGGLITAMIAARNPDVAFVISMAGTAVPGYDILLVQNERILEASGASEEEIAAAMEEVRQSMDLNVAEDWEALKELAFETGLKELEALPEEQREALGEPETYLRERIAELMPFYQGWMHFFLTYDPGEDWAQVDVPVLALFGGLDTQVDVEQNKPALEQALAEAGNGDVTVKVFPKANHLFQAAETGGPDEYAELPKEFVPGFLETISDWLLAHVETAAEARAALLQPLDAVVKQEMEDLNVPGAQVAVVYGDKIVYAKGFGTANVETGEPVTSDMLFRIGSTTKMYTAATLVALAEEGNVDLDAPIGDYIDGLDPEIAKLTAEQLMSHTAGLQDGGESWGPHDPSALGELVRSWTSDIFFTEPGEVFSYSNLGFTIAGLLVEEVGGEPYAEQVQARIFEPSGMTRTTFQPTVAMTYPHSQGHQETPAGEMVVVRPYPDHAGYWPAGFMISNVEDLGRFAIAFMNDGVIDGEQVLSPSTIEAMSTPHVEILGEGSYGYGLILHDYRGMSVVEHAGGIEGFTSTFKMVPEHRFAVIVLANRIGANFEQTADKAMELLLQLEPQAEKEAGTELPLTEEDLARYAGTYAQSKQLAGDVVAKDGQLVLSAMGIEVPMKKVGDATFTIELPGYARPIKLRFVDGPDGAVKYLYYESRALKKVSPTPTPTPEDVGLPNPAAVHCEEQGYTYEIRSDAAGNQYGVCIFPDGSECDAWAYFRGECAPESAPDADEGEAVDGWVGVIVKLPPGNQFGQYFEREDGKRYDVGATDEAVWDVIREAQSTGARVKVWGTLFTGVPASEARHIEVERIEIVSAAGWSGPGYSVGSPRSAASSCSGSADDS